MSHEREIAHRHAVALERIGTGLLRLAGAAEKAAEAYVRKIEHDTNARGRARVFRAP